MIKLVTEVSLLESDSDNVTENIDATLVLSEENVSDNSDIKDCINTKGCFDIILPIEKDKIIMRCNIDEFFHILKMLKMYETQ